MDGLSGREEDHEMKELTDDIAAATRKEAKFRKRRDNAARTLMKSGYTSKELAAPITVQHSRIRQYVSAGEFDDQYVSVKDFVDAFESWQAVNARVNRLKEVRNRAIIDRLDRGDRQVDVAADFGISQFLVSHIVNTKQEESLL